MKKILLASLFAFTMCLQMNAQVSLSGRVYHCANMMKEELQQAKKDFNKDVQNEKDATAEEKKEVDKAVQAMMDAIISTMTVKFLNDKELELSIVIEYDDDKAKAGGAPWVMRKLLKFKMRGKSFTKKAPYTFDGKTVKVTNPKSKKVMAFQLTPDGKALLYAKEKKTVRLSRTK